MVTFVGSKNLIFWNFVGKKVYTNLFQNCNFEVVWLILLNFLQWNLPNFVQDIKPSGILILNTRKSDLLRQSFSIFANLCHSKKKTDQIDFPENDSQLKLNIYYQVT